MNTHLFIIKWNKIGLWHRAIFLIWRDNICPTSDNLGVSRWSRVCYVHQKITPSVLNHFSHFGTRCHLGLCICCCICEVLQLVGLWVGVSSCPCRTPLLLSINRCAHPLTKCESRGGVFEQKLIPHGYVRELNLLKTSHCSGILPDKSHLAINVTSRGISVTS